MSAEVGGGEDGCARAFPSVGGVAGVVRTERGRVGVGRDRVELLRLAAETRDRHAEAKTLLDWLVSTAARCAPSFVMAGPPGRIGPGLRRARRTDYVTLNVPFMPAAAWPGSVQRYG